MVEGHFWVGVGGAFQEGLWCCAQVVVEEGRDVVAGDLGGAVAVEGFVGKSDAELLGEDREVGERGVARAGDGEPAPPVGEMRPAGVPGFVGAVGSVLRCADDHEGPVEVLGECWEEGAVEVEPGAHARVGVQDLRGAGAADGVADHGDPVRAQRCCAREFVEEEGDVVDAVAHHFRGVVGFAGDAGREAAVGEFGGPGFVVVADGRHGVAAAGEVFGQAGQCGAGMGEAG